MRTNSSRQLIPRRNRAGPIARAFAAAGHGIPPASERTRRRRAHWTSASRTCSPAGIRPPDAAATVVANQHREPARGTPARRSHMALDFEHAGIRYTAGLGHFDASRLAEDFLSAGKAGTAVETYVRDAAIVVSLLFQCGCPTAIIQRAITRKPDGSAAGAFSIESRSQPQRRDRRALEPGRDDAPRSHSSVSLVTAGAFGFLILIQSIDRPDRAAAGNRTCDLCRGRGDQVARQQGCASVCPRPRRMKSQMARAASRKGRGKKPAKKKAAPRKAPPAKRARRIADAATDRTVRRDPHQPISPNFPGNIPPQQFGAAAIGAAGSLTANTNITAASEASDTVEAHVTVGWPAHEEMLARLMELEAAVAELLPLPTSPGMGHNNPPPLDHQELENIKKDIALLKAQAPVPSELNSTELHRYQVRSNRRTCFCVDRRTAE